MMADLWTLLLVLVSVFVTQCSCGLRFNCEELKLSRFIFKTEAEMLRNAQTRTAVEWDYETNRTDHNEEIKRKYKVTSK
jgi:hypothetical protein